MIPRPALRRAASRALGLLAIAAAPLPAQMYGVPVLQNAFVNRGLGVAANYGNEDGGTAFGAAASYGPRGRRFVLSGGVGWYQPPRPSPLEELGRKITFGVRLGVPVYRSATGALGAAPFVGAGSASFEVRDPLAEPGDDSSNVTMSMLNVPVGLAVGYRRALGERRAFSVYAAPFYSWNRATLGDSSTSRGLVRVSLGLDVAIMPTIGLTLGYELGANAADDEPGPRSGIFGAGLSYALGARR